MMDYENFYESLRYHVGKKGHGGQALVCERGPVVVILPRGSSVTRLGQSKGMMGGVVVNVSGFIGNEYELARQIDITLKNQASNVARTTF